MLKLWYRNLAGQFTRSFRNYRALHGISLWHNVVDRVGGRPVEVAMLEEIFACYARGGFRLIRITTEAGDRGGDEFVFDKP